MLTAAEPRIALPAAALACGTVHDPASSRCPAAVTTTNWQRAPRGKPVALTDSCTVSPDGAGAMVARTAAPFSPLPAMVRAGPDPTTATAVSVAVSRPATNPPLS